jgi:hypothetical protein
MARQCRSRCLNHFTIMPISMLPERHKTITLMCFTDEEIDRTHQYRQEAVIGLRKVFSEVIALSRIGIRLLPN